MTNTAGAFQPAIDELEKDLAEAERNVNALLGTINLLRSKAGLPPRPPGGGMRTDSAAGHGTTATLSTIRPDTFYGKKMGTAAREFLEMRKIAQQGPAKPREVFDALKQGGFQFETKDDNVAMVSLRAMLRKNTVMFHKLPNGAYGLRSWYPNAKVPKAGEEAEAAEEPKKEAAAKPKAAAAS